MPFKSQAQRRKFAELLVKGEISPETFEQWNRETGGRKLPERVKGVKKRVRKATRTKVATGRTSATRARKRKAARGRKGARPGSWRGR
jgi:hypothetical protein